MKRKLYIIFDRFHSTEAGGLVSAYVSLYDLLKNDYDIEIISVMNAEGENHDRLKDVKVHYLTKTDFFPRLKVLVQAVKKFRFHIVLKEIFNLIRYLAFIPFAKKKMNRIISNNDIVISSSPAASMYIPKNVKFIQEIHTKFEYFWGDNFLGSLQRKLMSKPYITVFRTKSDMEKGSHYFNSTYSYNFIDKDVFDHTVSIGEEKRKHRIIYMGRFVKEKNIPKMIECAKQLKKKIPDFTLDMYGTGVLVEDVSKLIHENGLEKNVHLCGFCNDKNIFDNYSLLWLTSDFEGMSMTIIEAKAKGVPTISTNWGDGVFEVIHDKEDGFVEGTVEDIVNQTVELMNDKELLINISKNAYANFDEFSKENAYNRWIKLLKEFEGELK